MIVCTIQKGRQRSDSGSEVRDQHADLREGCVAHSNNIINNNQIISVSICVPIAVSLRARAGRVCAGRSKLKCISMHFFFTLSLLRNFLFSEFNFSN